MENVEKAVSISFRVRRNIGVSAIKVTCGDQVLASYKRERMAPGEMEHIAMPRVLLDKAVGDTLTVSVEEA